MYKKNSNWYSYFLAFSKKLALKAKPKDIADNSSLSLDYGEVVYKTEIFPLKLASNKQINSYWHINSFNNNKLEYNVFLSQQDHRGKFNPKWVACFTNINQAKHFIWKMLGVATGQITRHGLANETLAF